MEYLGQTRDRHVIGKQINYRAARYCVWPPVNIAFDRDRDFLEAGVFQAQ